MTRGLPRTAARHPSLPLAVVAVTASLALAAGFVAAGSATLPFVGLELTPALALAPFAAAASLFVIFKWPEFGLLLLVATVYTNLSEVAVRSYGLPSLLQPLALALTAALAVRALTAEDPRRRGLRADPLLIPLVLYGVIILASSLVADDPKLADERLADLVKGLLVFLLVINLTDSPLQLRRVVWALVLCGAFLGTVSVLQVLANSSGQEFGGFGRVKLAQVVGSVRQWRISGPLSDPNFYAQILVPLVPLALYRLWDETSTRLKLIAAYALLATLGALAVTYSRGGALAAGAVLALSAIQRRVRPRSVILVLLLVALVALSTPANFVGRLGTLEQFLPDEESQPARTESSVQQRRLLMLTAWEMFKENPMLGVGAGNYSERYDEYAARVGSAVSSYENFGERRYPHNLYLEVAAETGLLGLLAFAAVIAGALLGARSAVRAFRAAGDDPSAGLVTSAAVGLVGYLVCSLFLHGHYSLYLWLLVALLAAARGVARRWSQMPESPHWYIS